MITRVGGATDLRSIPVRRPLSAAFMGGLLAWLAIVSVRGASLVAQGFGFPVAGEPSRRFSAHQLLVAAVLVVLFCVIAALIARWLHPRATLPVACASAGLVLLAAALGSGSLGPLLLVLAMFAVVWVTGSGLLGRLPAPPTHPLVRLPLSIALGLSIVGLLLFLLASPGRLSSATVLILTGAILGSVLLLDRRRLVADLAHLRAWRPQTPGWFETIVIGLAVGSLAFAMLSDFVPENDSDASRDHLPVVREIWRSGAVGELPSFGASQDPVQAHLLYAVAYGLTGEGYAGITATKLVHAGVGLSAIVGIAALGWLCSGRHAAVVGAALFASTPLVLWGVGHPPLDLFPVLFTIAALLCLIHWQRVGAPAWLVVAGALTGFGFVAKITMAWVAVALAAAIFLVGRKPWRFWERVLAVLAFGLGTVVAVPWLARSYGITGTLPGLDTLLGLLASVVSPLGVQVGPEIGTPGDVSAPADPLAGAAATSPPRDAQPGHSLPDLVQSPWRLTFDVERYTYRTLDISPVGIAPLLLLPMVLLGPRTRTMALLAVTAALSYVGWWITPLQVVRHLLPTLAIVSVLAGVGVASAVAGLAAGLRRPLVVAARAGVIVGLVAGLMLFLPEKRVGISIDRITGRETAAEYVDREIPGAAMLAATDQLLPANTPVGYVGAGEYAEIYTEVRLIPLPGNIISPRSSATAPAEVLASLDRLGIDYVIWGRGRTKPEEWRSPLLSAELLRDHSRILAGDDNAYLFELLPAGGLTWGVEQPRNLLDDPGFTTIEREGGPWTTVGTVKTKGGLVSMQAESSVAQRVPVSGGNPYLLTAAAKCTGPSDRAELRLRWLDDDGVTIGTVAELVIPGTKGSEQFLWRLAPARATSVSVELASRSCAFEEATLYQLS